MDTLLIEIRSMLDYESYRSFARFMLFRGKGYKIGPVLLFIIFPIVILLTLCMWIFTHDIFPIILCILLVVILILFLNLYFNMPRVSYKKSKPLLADKIVFRFYEDHMEGDATGKNVKGVDSYQYAVFKKIYEVNSAFYLMMTNGMTLIIPKRYLNAEQINYLNKFFVNRFGNIYINCF